MSNFFIVLTLEEGTRVVEYWSKDYVDRMLKEKEIMRDGKRAILVLLAREMQDAIELKYYKYDSKKEGYMFDETIAVSLKTGLDEDLFKLIDSVNFTFGETPVNLDVFLYSNLPTMDLNKLCSESTKKEYGVLKRKVHNEFCKKHANLSGYTHILYVLNWEYNDTFFFKILEVEAVYIDTVNQKLFFNEDTATKNMINKVKNLKPKTMVLV